MDKHKTVTDDAEYDVTFHPGFASECTVTTLADNAKRQLYKQSEKHDCRPEGGHPKKHVIKLKGKNGKNRDITITIEDPTHSVHSLKLSLYDEARDPMVNQTFDATEEFTVMNSAMTCPPVCEE